MSPATGSNVACSTLICALRHTTCTGSARLPDNRGPQNIVAVNDCLYCFQVPFQYSRVSIASSVPVR